MRRRTGGEVPKVVQDTIHGLMELPGYCVKVIDTPEFQRLRSLKQLGVTSFVFPSATHTRFEHSLGVSFLANKMVTHLRDRQPELGITPDDVQHVTLAGLLHDLGHGPFSHAFECWARTEEGTLGNFHHENASVALLRQLFKENRIDVLGGDAGVTAIENMIKGFVPLTISLSGRTFLYRIVHNELNGLDVDKFDYLERDSFHTGMPCKHNFVRLIKFSRVIGGELCFASNVGPQLSELFHVRFHMFKCVYTHKVGLAIELMLSDILSLAMGPLRIAERVKDMHQYLYLTDAILSEVEVSTDPRLEPARALLYRLRTRDLYKLVGDVRIQARDKEQWRETPDSVRIQSIVQHAADAGSDLSVADVVLKVNKINWGFGAKNPLEKVSVYNHHDAAPVAKPLNPEELTSVVPSSVEDIVCMCFCKNRSLRHEAGRAWGEYCKAEVRDEFSESQHNEEALSRAGSVSGTPMSVLRTATPVTVVRSQDPTITQPDGGGGESSTKKPRTIKYD